MFSDSDSDSNDEQFQQLLNRQNAAQQPKSQNIWTKHLQDEELNDAFSSNAAVTLDTNFGNDEFKRYDPKFNPSYFEDMKLKIEQKEARRALGKKSSDSDKNSEKVENSGPESGECSSDDMFDEKPKQYKPKAQVTSQPKNLPKNPDKHRRRDPQKKTFERRFPSKTGKQREHKPQTARNSKSGAKKSHIEIARSFAVGAKFVLQKKGDLTAEMELDAFVNELCYRLREPHKALIKNIVEIIGKESAIFHYLKTEGIELAGGLPITGSLPKLPEIAQARNGGSQSQRSKSPTSSTSSENGPESANSQPCGIQLKPAPNLKRKTPGGVFLNLVYCHDFSTEINRAVTIT